MSTNALRIFIILGLFPLQLQLKIQLTKVVCTTLDKSFSRFDLCKLESNASQAATMSLIVKLLQQPLTNLQLHMEFSRLDENTSMTILNNTWDACKFLKNINKHRALSIFYELMKEYSNLNHSCPYNHDIRIMNFAPKVDKFAIPLPEGKYKLKNWYIVDGKDRMAIALTFSVKN